MKGEYLHKDGTDPSVCSGTTFAFCLLTLDPVIRDSYVKQLVQQEMGKLGRLSAADRLGIAQFYGYIGSSTCYAQTDPSAIEIPVNGTATIKGNLFDNKSIRRRKRGRCQSIRLDVE